jgi:hypothetical protein
MDIFDLSPEEISALVLAIAIGFSKEYTDDDQLEILAAFFNSLGDTIDLITLQRAILVEKTEKDSLNKADS